jgi:hypothetical protein
MRCWLTTVPELRVLWSRVLFRWAAAGLRSPVEGTGEGHFLGAEQRPEKPIAPGLPDLHLEPGECRFGAHMGRRQGCAVAELQVSEVSQKPTGSRGFVRIFDLRPDRRLAVRSW